MRNAALSAIVGGITDTVAALSMMPSSSAPSSSSSSAVKPSQQLSPAAVQSTEESNNNMQQAGGGEGVDSPEGKNYRMDIQDFIESVPPLLLLALLMFAPCHLVSP
jgi:hypothetical protein